MWLFHLHSAVKNAAFFPVLPLAGATAKAFFRLSLWSFKGKALTIFYGCVIENGWCFISWNSKEITSKIAQSWSPPAEKWRKTYIFQHIAETKQPCAMTEPFLLYLTPSLKLWSGLPQNQGRYALLWRFTIKPALPSPKVSVCPASFLRPKRSEPSAEAAERSPLAPQKQDEHHYFRPCALAYPYQKNG